MTNQCADKGRLGFVGKPEFLRSLLNNGRDLAVVNVADVREQVMFNLKVQTSNVPVQDSIIVGEVRCCKELVDGPAVLHFALTIGHRIFRSVDDMRRLKDDCKNKSADVMHGQKAEQNLPPRHGQQERR